MTKDEILQLSKECVTENISSSRLITSKPCYIFSVIICVTSVSTAAILNLRNGELATSDILIAFNVRNATAAYSPRIPFYFNKGLYIELNINITNASVQYLLAH